MKNEINKFIDICRLSQEELKKFLKNELTRIYKKNNLIDDNGFLYAKGDIPILLIAHLDTVHEQLPTIIHITGNDKKNTIISSPQGIGGDDRCGVYIILKILSKGYKPHVLFCENEEIGCVGAMLATENIKVIESISTLNYIIELDRKGNKDAVYYDCYNTEFIDYIRSTIEYEEEYGSFSDISVIAPKTKIAAVNLSCGYYNAHTSKEYVVFQEMENTCLQVEKLLKTKSKQFEYIDIDAYDYEYKENNIWDLNLAVTYKEKDFLDEDSEDNIVDEIISGDSEAECWGEFFISHPNVCYNDIIDYEIF